MIPEALFVAIMVCGPTKVDNRVDLKDSVETQQDVDILLQAKKRCGELYPDSPCVTQFIIKLDDWGDRMYSIACGQKVKKDPVMQLR